MKMSMTDCKTDVRPPEAGGQKESHKQSTQDDHLTIASLVAEPLLSLDKMLDNLKTILGLGRQKDGWEGVLG